MEATTRKAINYIKKWKHAHTFPSHSFSPFFVFRLVTSPQFPAVKGGGGMKEKGEESEGN